MNISHLSGELDVQCAMFYEHVNVLSKEMVREDEQKSPVRWVENASVQSNWVSIMLKFIPLNHLHSDV